LYIFVYTVQSFSITVVTQKFELPKEKSIMFLLEVG